ncbi:hypothetical protein DICVIV_01164 [Dictyocaulus viviparus]|uniref:Uncharacterized protein n=1 Tax=Dictyocaulus viviparus TaxID=29172 RepID=A0A0D8Y9A6_DICVI|nr:hypothetical protein DICVIV_01164 [Dictyocaulus viviparus]
MFGATITVFTFASAITTVLAKWPTLRDLLKPSEQLAFRDTLSHLVEFEYRNNAINSDDSVLSKSTSLFPTINQLNSNYSEQVL